MMNYMNFFEDLLRGGALIELIEFSATDETCLKV